MRWPASAPVRRPSGFIEPCLPTISRTVPTGSQWAFEIKHDGFRFLAVRQGKQVRVYSRGGHDWSKQLAAIWVRMNPCRSPITAIVIACVVIAVVIISQQ